MERPHFDRTADKAKALAGLTPYQELCSANGRKTAVLGMLDDPYGAVTEGRYERWSGMSCTGFVLRLAARYPAERPR
jgi:hypothetical protein